MTVQLSRRDLLRAGTMALPLSTLHGSTGAFALAAPQAKERKTEFQIACMTLPFGGFPLQTALTGLKDAGYEYVAWGTRHREADGKRVPILGPDASPQEARDLAQRCRDLGLEPLMMFSMIYPEHEDGLEVLKKRIYQAAAGGLPQVLTFGHTEGGDRNLWVKRFKVLGPIARDSGVLLVVKQHGGSTGTGEACADIIREVSDEGVKVNYDAGNVMDYLNVDPIPDIQKCADVVRSFCIKDHRNFPLDQDCGPGLGEIDHYRLLQPVAYTGLKMPLCCENIFAPVVPRPTEAEGVVALARRAREFLELVIEGLHTPIPAA